MRRLLAPLAALLALAALTRADPVVERLESRISGNRRLEITFEALLEGKGELVVEGEVAGRKFKKRKRVRKAGAARLNVKVDPRRLRVRKLDGPLDFTLTATATEKGGASVSRPVEARVPVPVVFLPGLGNEVGPDVASAAFTSALALAAVGDGLTTGGDAPTLVVHGYDSLSESLSDASRSLEKRVRRVLRGTPFARVDVVGYSMGGLVARRWEADGGRARRMILLATPNEGAPLAQLLGIALQSDLLPGGALPDLGGDAVPADFLEALVGDGAGDTLRTFYPTYTWLFVTIDAPLVGGRLPVTQQLVDTFGSFVPGLSGLTLDFGSPLTPLNAIGPSTATSYHAIGYSSVPGQGDVAGLGTIDEVDVGQLLAGGQLDPLSLATGDGDGLVPWRSLVMADTPGWAERIDATDLGAGTHVTLLADPACIRRVAEILSE